MLTLEQHRANIARIRRIPRPLHPNERHRFTVENVKVGGLIQIGQTIYLVTGKNEYQEGKQWHWSELELTSAIDGKIIFLEFERDDQLEMSLWYEFGLSTQSVGLTNQQLESFDDEEEGSFSYDGHTFVYSESDKAIFYRNGNKDSGEEHYYWDFESQRGNRLLCAERWEDSYEVSLGRALEETEVVILNEGGVS